MDVKKIVKPLVYLQKHEGKKEQKLFLVLVDTGLYQIPPGDQMTEKIGIKINQSKVTCDTHSEYFPTKYKVEV